MTSDRIKEIQETTAYPESVSVKQALLQVWNECEQTQSAEISELKKEKKKQFDAWTHSLALHKERELEWSAERDKLREAVQKALNIKELWLPYSETCAPEHEEEAIVLQQMHNNFINALSS